MTKLKHSYFGHIMGNQDSLEKTMMLGKIEDIRERRPNMRWMKETTGMSLQVLGRADKDRTLRAALIQRAAQSQN